MHLRKCHFISTALSIWIAIPMTVGCEQAARPSSPVNSHVTKDKTKEVVAPIVGSHFGNLHGRSMSQKQVTIDFAGRNRGALLFVLAPHCPYCRLNFHNWRELAAKTPKGDVFWIDLSASADPEYKASYGIPETADVLLLDEQDGRANRLLATPTTIFLGPHATVRWAAAGVMNSTQVAELSHLVTQPH